MSRIERMKLKRRMQRRIRLVVEERRMALALPPLMPLETDVDSDPDFDPDTTIEIKRAG
jgi:hypothetical protein